MVSQSVSQSRCRAPAGSHDQIFITVWQLRSCFCGDPFLTRGRICLLSEPLSAVVSHLSWCNRHLDFTRVKKYTYKYTWPLSVQAQYSILCPICSSFRYNGILVTWTVSCVTAAKLKHLIFPMSGFALSNNANIFVIVILYIFCLLPA
jgi:hypothetical protein